MTVVAVPRFVNGEATATEIRCSCGAKITVGRTVDFCTIQGAMRVHDDGHAGAVA